LRPLAFTSEGKEPAIGPVSRWLTGVAAVVLLIACANIGNLLLARAVRRRGEIAMRLALGMSRRRLAQWILIESLMIAVLGGAFGIAAAYAAGRAVREFFLKDVVWTSSTIDWGVVWSIVALVGGVTLLVSLVPLARAGRVSATDVLKAGIREGGGRRERLRSALLLVQTGLTTALLLAAGLFVRSLINVRQLDLGIETDRVMVASIYWPLLAQSDSASRAKEAAYERVTLERIRDSLAHRSDIEAATLAIGSPFRSAMTVDLSVPGWDSVPKLGGGGPYVSAVGPDYLKASGGRLLRGRTFGPNEGANAPLTAIVNETMANTLWRGNAIGKCLRVGGRKECSTVVGIVSDAHRFGIDEEPAMQYYVPLGQEIGFAGTGILVRPRGRVEGSVDVVRRTIGAMVPGARYVDVAPLQDRVDPQIRPWRLGAAMFGVFGLLALVVAATGLYSVIGYVVAQRRRELGVRIAIGATGGDIVRLIVMYGMRVVSIGVAVGLLIGWFTGRALEPQLFQESAHDPMVYAATAVIVSLVAMAALIAPALRASGTNPALALNEE